VRLLLPTSSRKNAQGVIYNAEEKPWGHSVPSLLDQACVILQIESGKAPVVEAEELDEHYARPRYPDVRSGVEDAYDRETAEDALRQVRTICAFVEEHLRNA
jgi:HEPN domain-containing protein